MHAKKCKKGCLIIIAHYHINIKIIFFIGQGLNISLAIISNYYFQFTKKLRRNECIRHHRCPALIPLTHQATCSFNGNSHSCNANGFLFQPFVFLPEGFLQQQEHTTLGKAYQGKQQRVNTSEYPSTTEGRELVDKYPSF